MWYVTQCISPFHLHGQWVWKCLSADGKFLQEWCANGCCVFVIGLCVCHWKRTVTTGGICHQSQAKRGENCWVSWLPFPVKLPSHIPVASSSPHFGRKQTQIWFWFLSETRPVPAMVHPSTTPSMALFCYGCHKLVQRHVCIYYYLNLFNYFRTPINLY